MKLGFFDGSSGASGDMILGALVASGFPVSELQRCVSQLNLSGVRLRREDLIKQQISGCRVIVEIDEEHEHRHLEDIIHLITKAGLPPTVKEKAIRIFTRLAEAEAAVHGCAPEEIHFHEVGAKDAIVDIVGACYGLEYLKIDKISCSPLRLGFGETECAHGLLPVPAPAVLSLLKNAPVFAGRYEGEWTTPTGAAILTCLSSEWGQMPQMVLETVGYGAGTREAPYPNFLRLLIGEAIEQRPSGDEVELLETAIDDLSPEILSFLGEKLFTLPVLDFQVSPVVMKKGRLGHKLTILVDPALVNQAVETLFTETSTFGVRRSRIERICLERRSTSVPVRGGTVRVKEGSWQGRIMHYAPEFEDCRRVASATGAPLKMVYDEAKRAWEERTASTCTEKKESKGERAEKEG